jgi:hypothetical protein
MMITELAGLGSATARARNLVPANRKRDTGTTGERVGIKHDQPGPVTEIDLIARGGNES